MKFKIDHNTPLPPPGTRPAKNKSLVETMMDMPVDINSSFLVPIGKRKAGGIRAEVYAAAKTVRALEGGEPVRKYTTRMVLKEKGVRVWRTQ